MVSGDWAFLDRTFQARFGAAVSFRVQAPGRVNLIGEHTDYNEGFVLPLAINRYVRLAVHPVSTPTLRFYAVHFGEEIEMSADHPDQDRVPDWARYIQGTAVVLRQAGVRLRGVTGVVGGDLPVEAGLSSSAAVEVATALALLRAAGTVRSPREIALLAQRAEVEFVGVRCGIMDQLTVALARPGHALFLDCRTLAVEHVPWSPSVVLVVCDTGVRRSLAQSAYNERREECARAVECLQRLRPSSPGCATSRRRTCRCVAQLPEPLRRRARHVVTENGRVLDATAALRRGDSRRRRHAPARVARQPARRLRGQRPRARGHGIGGGTRAGLRGCADDGGRVRRRRSWRSSSGPPSTHSSPRPAPPTGAPPACRAP